MRGGAAGRFAPTACEEPSGGGTEAAAADRGGFMLTALKIIGFVIVCIIALLLMAVLCGQLMRDLEDWG